MCRQALEAFDDQCDAYGFCDRTGGKDIHLGFLILL